MGTTKDKRWYLDSCILVALLQDEQVMEGTHTRGEIARWVFDQRSEQGVTLYTSTLGIIEANGGNATADSELRKNIQSFFLDDTQIELIDIDYSVAELARNLTWQVRDDGCTIKHNVDMAHIAAGIIAECSDLLTFDRKHMVTLGKFICDIDISVPAVSGQIRLLG